MFRSFSKMSSKPILFGQHYLDPGEIFFRSKLSLGFVNLMPVVAGNFLLFISYICKVMYL